MGLRGPRLGADEPRNCAPGHHLPVLALPLLGRIAMPADPLQERREHERKAKVASRQDLLFSVSRHALDHYERLKGIFADANTVTIILDRRRQERRKTSGTRSRERRRADRRSRPAIDGRLHIHGWAMVRLELSMDTPNRK